MICDGDYAVTELKNRNWSYFIEIILGVYQNGLELIIYSITEKWKNKIITDTVQNFKIVNEQYMS